ncbi:hypothetical protein DFP72DRAFT_1071992 [Ephemerocybe angulata]|uniref:Uncharacterized protein n=1 Tax=Ephemerocybe angulata TaxID=980116 RepID=A0A8H6HPM1_9AGAR|nr:hypothetical protein DFP72DRAFT_1071992 [Tulosesus angulatus]
MDICEDDWEREAALDAIDPGAVIATTDAEVESPLSHESPSPSTAIIDSDTPINSEVPIPDGKLQLALALLDASQVLMELKNLMKGDPYTSRGYKSPGFDPFVHHRLEGMRAILSLYTDPRSLTQNKWVLPLNPYGCWNESWIVDEDLVNDLNLFLQEQGKEISGAKVTEFLHRSDIKEKYGITQNISE